MYTLFRTFLHSGKNTERVDLMVLQLGAFAFTAIAVMLTLLEVAHLSHLI